MDYVIIRLYGGGDGVLENKKKHVYVGKLSDFSFFVNGIGLAYLFYTNTAT